MKPIQEHQNWQSAITQKGQNSFAEDYGLNKVGSLVAAPFKTIGNLFSRPAKSAAQFINDYPIVKQIAFGAFALGAALGLVSLVGFADRIHFITAIKNSWWFKEILSRGTMMLGFAAIAAACLTASDGSLWSSTKIALVGTGLQVVGAIAFFEVLH